MKDAIITVSGLGKRYLLTHAVRSDTLRDTLIHSGRNLARRLLGHTQLETREDFWALRNVGFEVMKGEVVGIIGRNGAGKSTLLKILSRITEPTSGSIRLRGRVASLLEVGTGFHPELSGRENIYLNGAILGMSRSEIRRKFDEIVAFAEVERFLDTPVKHYSSGMYVRLAFAVAAHLEPEILIVDEVLAVGDAAFQKKCLGKMKDVTIQEGRTVLFVSHQMTVIRQLCSSAILLQAGQLAAQDRVEEIVSRYEASFAESHRLSYQRPASAPFKACSFQAVEIHTNGNIVNRAFNSQFPITLTIDLFLTHVLPSVQIALRISTMAGQAVLTTTNADSTRNLCRLEKGRHRFSLEIPPIFAPGSYKLTLAACEPQREVFDVLDDVLGFEIDRLGSLSGDLRDDRQGLVEMLLPWQHETSA